MSTPCPKRLSSKAFTVVELLVVITIISLLIFGLMGASNLKRQSELAKIMADISGEKVVFSTFFDLYGEFPGDFSQATHFINSAATNGNGDYIFDDAEAVRYWRHLELAGLTNKNFDGVTWSSGRIANAAGTGFIGIGLPEGPTKRSAYYPHPAQNPWGPGTTSLIFSSIYDDNADGDIDFTANTLDRERAHAVLTPREALGIDTKHDDGIPDAGSMRAYDATNSTCLSGSSFDQTITEESCILEVRIY